MKLLLVLARIMAFIKYLTYSGKKRLRVESWLESYKSAAKVEEWSTSQMFK